jgi:hypothetical protein
MLGLMSAMLLTAAPIPVPDNGVGSAAPGTSASPFADDFSVVVPAMLAVQETLPAAVAVLPSRFRRSGLLRSVRRSPNIVRRTTS